MRKYARTMSGVTLLEIMLVLAIASMVIVMSVRYYQSASANQQANAFVAQIQAITAAAENLAQGQGYGSVTKATLSPILPANTFTAPWGGALDVPAGAADSVTISVGAPSAAVCALIKAKMTSSAQYSGSTWCTSIVYKP